MIKTQNLSHLPVPSDWADGPLAWLGSTEEIVLRIVYREYSDFAIPGLKEPKI